MQCTNAPRVRVCVNTSRFKDDLRRTLESWWFNALVLVAAAVQVALYIALHTRGDGELVYLGESLRAAQVHTQTKHAP